MRFPFHHPAGDLAVKTHVLGSPELLFEGNPLPQIDGAYRLPEGGSAKLAKLAKLVYRRDPFIPALEIEGETQEAVSRSPLALALSILPLVIGAALGASLGDRLGGGAVLVLGVLLGSIVGYFFQKAVYFVLRSPNHPAARVLITVGLYLALLMLAVFTTAVLALIFPEQMAG